MIPRQNDHTTVHPIKVGTPLRARSDGRLWVVCSTTRVGVVTYHRYENGWHVGCVARKDVDHHFTKPRLPQ